jgi:hypothetical protein
MKDHFTCAPSNGTITTGDKWRSYLASTRKFRDAWTSDQPQDMPDWPDLGTGDLKAVYKARRTAGSTARRRSARIASS